MLNILATLKKKIHEFAIFEEEKIQAATSKPQVMSYHLSCQI